MKSGFAELLAELSTQVDHVIVEPSGVFTLGDYFEVMQAPLLKDCCETGIVATVVDAGMLDRLTEEDIALFTAQICGTGCVLCNRWELSSRQAIVDFVGQYAKPPVFFEGDPIYCPDFIEMGRCREQVALAIRADITHATIYQSTSLFPQVVYRPENIPAIVQEALNGSCGEVLRLKGYLRVRADDVTDGSSVLEEALPREHAVILNATISGFRMDRSSQQQTSMINVIGRHLNRKRLKELFEMRLSGLP